MLASQNNIRQNGLEHRIDALIMKHVSVKVKINEHTSSISAMMGDAYDVSRRFDSDAFRSLT